MNKTMIAAGAFLAILGAVLLVFALRGVSSQQSASDALGLGTSAVTNQRAQPMLLTVAAGLCLAGGAGLLGIGANSWYAYRKRTLGHVSVRR